MVLFIDPGETVELILIIYGFCLSPEVMKYKHEVAIQSSKYYSDSIPSKEWYQDKWLNWTPETRDIEIAEKHKHKIKQAWPYQK